MSNRQPSIKKRVRAVILLACVIVLFVTAAAFIIYEALSFRAQLVRNLSTLAAVIADNSAAPLAFDNETIAEEILDALKAQPDIVAAALYDLKGNVFAKYPPALQSDLLPTRLNNAGHQFRDGTLIFFQPVIQEQKQLGTLYLQSSLQGLYEQFWRYGLIVATVLIALLAGSFMLSTLLQRRISDPIIALTEAAHVVAENRNYSIRAPKVTQDELGMLTDAFNRMLSETQENQDRLGEQARLLDLSTDAIIVRDMQGLIVFWNRGAEEIYGWKREEALGRAKTELLRTEFPEPLEQITAKLQRHKRWTGDLIQTRRDGIRIHVNTRWVLDSDVQGALGRVLITDNDITTRKQAEELMKSEAKRLDTLVEQRTASLHETIGELEAFSYSISHDMRAPLRAMQGYAKALLSDYKDRLDPEAIHYLDRISRSSNRLDSLIQDILAYSRVSKDEILLHPVDVERLIDDIFSTHPEFQAPQVHIAVQKPLHRVLGHEAYLTQCITNLLGNAIKFVAQGVVPEIRIRSERLDGKVRLWFEDNGIGIDPSHHERIFQIFGQVYPEKKYGGTGIGLAIVRKAVQRMNGEAGVESGTDKGSRFWLILNEGKYDNYSVATVG
ncbi:MAG TPA: ATP-binding protein [Candidatus Polarisedimenticolaceae bacterium]|nr:ATP-binding protein [Candidatus Polarisedimenticolaceae bacterium]